MLMRKYEMRKKRDYMIYRNHEMDVYEKYRLYHSYSLRNISSNEKAFK